MDFCFYGVSMLRTVFNHCRNAGSQGFRDAWKKGKVHGVPIAASRTRDVLQMPEAAGLPATGRVQGAYSSLGSFYPSHPFALLGSPTYGRGTHPFGDDPRCAQAVGTECEGGLWSFSAQLLLHSSGSGCFHGVQYLR